MAVELFVMSLDQFQSNLINNTHTVLMKQVIGVFQCPTLNMIVAHLVVHIKCYSKNT